MPTRSDAHVEVGDPQRQRLEGHLGEGRAGLHQRHEVGAAREFRCRRFQIFVRSTIAGDHAAQSGQTVFAVGAIEAAGDAIARWPNSSTTRRGTGVLLRRYGRDRISYVASECYKRPDVKGALLDCQLNTNALKCPNRRKHSS